ncbi:PadR family transcriptional regulator [Pseudomonadota bacterium AL_CKDN230030165-1A_HGKHYDSX7]
MARTEFLGVITVSVNLTKVEAAILQQLVAAAGSELYGLQMVDKDKGVKRGSIYVYLGRLIDKGFVESRLETDSDLPTPRRLYKITATGVRQFRAQQAAEQSYARAFNEAMAT